MINSILSSISSLVLNIISGWGYWGVMLLMALESANIPIPSEIILPFAGFLVSTGRFGFASVVLVAAIGNLVGSLINYYVAYYYRDKAVAILTKTHLITEDELERSTKWFERRGVAAVFLGRFLPVIRTFISFPAGMFRVNIIKFSILTFMGSFLWSVALTYIGYLAGSNWNVLEPYFRQFDYLVVLAIVVAIFFEVRRRFKRSKVLK